MDRRTVKTRAAIFEAFNQLLLVKKYSRITIQEIIDTANIGRSTFYAHFETKDELLKAICTEMFDHIFSKNLLPEPGHDFSQEEGDASAMTTHILCHLQENRKILQGIFASESCELFFSYFKQYLLDFVDHYILISPRNIHNIPLDFLRNHLAGSFIEMVKWWFKSDLAISPCELSTYYAQIVFPLVPK